MQQSDYEIVGKFGFESRPHRLRKKTEIRKSKTISSKSVTLGIFFVIPRQMNTPLEVENWTNRVTKS